MPTQLNKLLVVGFNTEMYSCSGIIDGARSVFKEIVFYDWQYARFTIGIEKMREEIKSLASITKPDVIFLHFNHNNEALTLEEYKFLSNISTLIAYTEDVRKDNSWFKEVCQYANCLFTNKDDVVDINSADGHAAYYLPVSYNHLLYNTRGDTPERGSDIVFIGNNYVNTNLDFPLAQQRFEMAATLKKQFPNNFKTYGNGQEFPPVNTTKAKHIYQTAFCSISHNNFLREGYQSDRALNSIACGCPSIMAAYPGIENDFGGMFCGSWSTIDELCQIIELRLTHGKYFRQLIEHQMSLLKQYHTWSARFMELSRVFTKPIRQ